MTRNGFIIAWLAVDIMIYGWMWADNSENARALTKQHDEIVQLESRIQSRLESFSRTQLTNATTLGEVKVHMESLGRFTHDADRRYAMLGSELSTVQLTSNEARADTYDLKRLVVSLGEQMNGLATEALKHFNMRHGG